MNSNKYIVNYDSLGFLFKYSVRINENEFPRRYRGIRELTDFVISTDGECTYEDDRIISDIYNELDKRQMRKRGHFEDYA